MKYLFLTLVQIMVLINITAQTRLPLYDGLIPGSKSTNNKEKSETKEGITIVSEISVPELIIYPAARKKRNGSAIIIFPGGGYWVNAISHEGTDVATLLATEGFTCFVGKY